MQGTTELWQHVVKGTEVATSAFSLLCKNLSSVHALDPPGIYIIYFILKSLSDNYNIWCIHESDSLGCFISWQHVIFFSCVCLATSIDIICKGTVKT